MYAKFAPTATGTAGGGMLAFTGFESMWLVVVAGTMIALGAAALRIARQPRDTAYDAD